MQKVSNYQTTVKGDSIVIPVATLNRCSNLDCKEFAVNILELRRWERIHRSWKKEGNS